MQEEEQSVDLGRYIAVLLHWWWAIALVFAILVAGAYTYSTLIKKTVYRARSTILIQESRSGLAPGLGDIQASRELASTYRQLMTTRPLLQRVIDELALPYDVDGLRGKVNISVRPGTPLLDVEVEDRDPEPPVRIASTLTQVFIQDRQTSRLTEIARLEAAATAAGTRDTSALVEAQLSTLASMSIVEDAIFSTPFVTPSTQKNMLLAGLLGIFLGILLAFLLDYSSNKIKSVDQVDKLFQLDNLTPSLVGVVFQWTQKEVPDGTLVVETRPDSIYSEMFRQVRTGFQFATGAYPGKAYMISSVGPQEGKSTILSNLSAVLAQGGSQVTMVDSDLRRPTLHRFVGLDRRRGGLSSLIADTQSASAQLRETEIPGLKTVLSGPVPTNPADLLNSPRMDRIIDDLKAGCDYLLLDSPPIMAAADATILASKVDGVILVITMGDTRTDTFRDALRQIQRAGTPIVGYVINKVKTQRLGYGRYRYWYQYYYYSRKEEDTEPSDIGGNGAQPASSGRSDMSGRLRRRIQDLLNPISRRRR